MYPVPGLYTRGIHWERWIYIYIRADRRHALAIGLFKVQRRVLLYTRFLSRHSNISGATNCIPANVASSLLTTRALVFRHRTNISRRADDAASEIYSCYIWHTLKMHYLRYAPPHYPSDVPYILNVYIYLKKNIIIIYMCLIHLVKMSISWTGQTTRNFNKHIL